MDGLEKMLDLEQTMLYAVTKKLGGVIELTIFENGNASTIELSAEMANGLAELLTETNKSNDGDWFTWF